jgi:cell division protease FtsH
MPNNKKKKESKEMEMLKKMFEGKTPKRQNQKRRNPFVTFLLMVFLLTALYQIFGGQFSEEAQNPREKVAISQIQEYYKNGNLVELTVKKGRVLADTKDGAKLFAYKLPNETVSDLGFNLADNNTKISVSDIESDAFWGDLVSSVLPILIILAIIIFLMRRATGGGGGGFGFGSSRAKLFNKEDSTTKFKDVAGSEEAKEELVEVVDFLKKPKKYLKIGAKIPKGILLVGSPGTGKTLLARAVAGEAGVPFFSISGSEFIEMFVGVGASRVRDLFQKAKKLSPAIIFIDEIDAIGKQRGHGFGGGHDEREQTLNQILSEMDGFETGTTVIILAATNRPEVLDKALLRPGRFDRRVVIDKPDLQARIDILKVHANKKPLAKDVKFEDIAKKTSGFSGAELESVMNEAAIATAKVNKKTITQAALFEAVEKVMMGPEKRSAKHLEEEKKITAYHEVGHALISHEIPECDPVHKISIVARGMSLGSTWYLPDEERRMYSKAKFLAEVCSLLGGRLGEEIKFGKDKITTGASNDFQRATSIARRMVMEYGMSPLGPIVFGEDGGGAYTGADFGSQKNYSEETAQKIDEQVAVIINTCLEKGRKILQDNIAIFESITQYLLEKEVVSSEEFEEFFKKKKSVQKKVAKKSA